jgi:SpoVK/Ycf46/Vps4 family AAA+-type ATPase
LRDAALAAAKAYSHPEVQPRHVGYAIARYFHDRPEVSALLAKAREALEPRGTAHTVPTFTEEATALLRTITASNDALEALKELLGEEGAPMDAEGVKATSEATSESEKPVRTASSAPAEPSETVEDVLAELDALIGLDHVKAQVRSVMAVVWANQERAKAGLTMVNPGLNLVFTGAPGTGKTTVARLVGRLYAASGALPGSNFTEVDRSDLVAGYVGQTAMKTTDVIRKTLPGVLFVDEAYSLTPSHASDYGFEAIATLVKAMEDHRRDLAVIVAGYGDEMAAFVESNPGLRSRLRTFIDFPDYAPHELARIFDLFAESNGLHLSDEALNKAEEIFERVVNRPEFGNARFARTLFEQAYVSMALRAAEDAQVHVDELSELVPEDLVWDDSERGAGQRRIGFESSVREDGANERK